MVVIASAAVICSVFMLIYFKKSGHFIKSLILSFAQGFTALLAVNAVGSMIGIALPLNPITVGSSAIFGTSGVIMNLITQIILLRISS